MHTYSRMRLNFSIAFFAQKWDFMPMIASAEILQTAQKYIENYGDKALLEARKRASFYSAAGSSASALLWHHIAETVEKLQIGDFSSQKIIH